MGSKDIFDNISELTVNITVVNYYPTSITDEFLVLDVARQGGAALADVVVARHGAAKVCRIAEACRADVVLRVDVATVVDAA